MHTSGSTGAGTPVALTYANWLWSALGSSVAVGHPRDERWLCALPLSHVGGLSVLLRAAIGATTVILHERFEAQAALEELARPDGPTAVSLVPTTLQRLLDAGLRRPPALRTALLGGGPVPPALLDYARDAGVPVVTTYGLTEACSQVATGGAPLFCTRVRIADEGEILVSGPTVALGAAGPDGWLRTGDLGELAPDGTMRVTGRAADTIVTGGENVAPTEVEALLELHPAVTEAAIHARPDPEWGEAVVATVVLRAPATEAQLIAHCAAHLAPYQAPKAIAFADALPRTPSGKLRRAALRVPCGPMTFDAETFRHESAQRWSAVATGWATNRATFQAAMAPVSAWMLEALGPQPGHRVLELAAGPGDTGLMAAQRIRPGGTLICTDVAEEMLDAARARAQELGLVNVEFKAMDAEWIDLPAADVDGVLCRFGYMLLADPAAALRETRRVLRPGGRVVLAAWTGARDNPWNAVPGEELRRLTGAPPPAPGTPGPLSFGDPQVLDDLLGEAGFLDARIEQLDLTFAFDGLDTWWDVQLDLGASLREGVAALTPAQRDDLRDAIDARLTEYAAPDGSVRIPARTHLAVAEA